MPCVLLLAYASYRHKINMSRKENTETKPCPRCGLVLLGKYPAISRTDNKTEICSECGQQEALEAFFNH